MVSTKDEYPEFLRLLDTDRTRAAEEFYRYAVALFTSKPPRILRGFDQQMRDDLTMEVILHCLKGDFRVLRTYEPSGKAWAGWFYLVAANKIIDLLDSPKYRAHKMNHDDKGRPIEEMESDCGESNPTSTPGNQMLVDLVNSLIDKLDEQCRVLLRLVAEEYRPREIVLILSMPLAEAKKIADRIKYCRSKLDKLLNSTGLTVEQLLADI
jgi:RNA polymerase sigma factor (sigma-70 family)